MRAPANLLLPDENPPAVHVWTAALDVPDASLAAHAALLDADESARVRRFHFTRDQRHFTAARGTLRALLGRYLGVPGGAVRFSYGERGKPAVAWPETALKFNVSHSDGRALFAFARGREVGVDLEAGARLGDDWPGVARRVFSAREQAELFALPPGQRRRAFLDGWTRKEAYLKATGLGIVDGLQSIEVTLDPARPPAVLAGPAGTDWQLHDLRGIAGDGIAAALLVAGREAVKVQVFGEPGGAFLPGRAGVPPASEGVSPE